MNNDLISREALKKCARVVFDKDLGRLRVVDVSDVDNAPTVKTYCYFCGQTEHGQIEDRTQGEWVIVKDKKYGDNVKCPFCGKELAGTDLNFCCKCGAKLRRKLP